MQHGYITGASPSVIGQVGGEYKTASRLDDRSYIGNAEQAIRYPEVEEADRRIEAALQKLDDALGQYVMQCQKVMRAPIPQEVGAKQASEPLVNSPLGQRLTGHARMIEELTASVYEAKSRLEI